MAKNSFILPLKLQLFAEPGPNPEPTPTPEPTPEPKPNDIDLTDILKKIAELEENNKKLAKEVEDSRVAAAKLKLEQGGVVEVPQGQAGMWVADNPDEVIAVNRLNSLINTIF